jgi:hypothetical protein
MAAITVLNYHLINSDVEGLYHTIITFPLFFFPDACVLVRIEPNPAYQYLPCPIDILYPAFTGLSCQQRIQ